MKPEDVDAWLVEKAYQAYLDDYAEGVEDSMPAILAAVLPEIQAQALREAADRLDDESGDPFREIAPLVRNNGSGLIGAVYGTAQWLRNRAARLREGGPS